MRALYGLAAAFLLWSGAGSGASLIAGKASYAVCAGCHGFEGEGNVAVAAPKLTGLDGWYAARQLDYFGRGIRGADERDSAGRQMAPFALVLPDSRAIEDLVAYLDSLPHRPPVASIAGDAERGRALYALCAACHGADGSGNEQLSAPALAGLDDWYLVRQLQLYRDGLRGTQAGDVYGAQMRPIADTLDDEQQLRDLAVYILTLQ